MKFIKKLNNKYYSTLNNFTTISNVEVLENKDLNSKLKMTSTEFKEWFSGFVDGEGCFIIAKTFTSRYQFVFTIGLHIDDIDVLYNIKNILNFGKISIYKNKAFFKVNKQDDIKLLINIFDEFKLNTTKRLDYLDWKNAFNIYLDRCNNYLLIIEDIKNGMNTKRLYKESKFNDIVITNYWLLGFIEGEGCFNVEKSLTAKFRLGQVSRDRFLLEKICFYIEQLAEFYGYPIDLKKNPLHIYDSISDFEKKNAKPFSILCILQDTFNLNVIIPFLSNLFWLSKKELDFKDWVLILKLKSTGKHLIPEGKELILKLISQMNSGRLSTNLKESKPIDRIKLYDEILLLLKSPSNYEIINGKKYNNLTGKLIPDTRGIGVKIIDENGEVFMSFDTGMQCGNYLGIGRTSVYSKIKSQRPILIDNKKYYIRLIN